jgi:transcriptional regulator with XRE-family HTH domain
VANRTDLGDFLRSRREQLSPAEVGLPDAGRRRTPGLRREEVATLAGLSMDYLVRLEQGRDRNPSVLVLTALADALRLDDTERAHLLKLAACTAAPDQCPLATGRAEEVPATTIALLDRLDPTPAVILGPWYEVVAYNTAWERIMRGVGLLDGPHANLARFTFLDPRSRAVFPAWSDAADEQAAVLREVRVRWREDARLQSLIDELLAEPEFAVRWQAHEVARKRPGTKVIVHPEAGPLRIVYEVLDLTNDSGQRMITWLPADDATASTIRRLAAGDEPVSPARLRVVGD